MQADLSLCYVHVLRVASNKRSIQKLFCYFFMKTYCGYSFEVPQVFMKKKKISTKKLWVLIRSTEMLLIIYKYQQHMFSWRNEKNINAFLVEKKRLIWSLSYKQGWETSGLILISGWRTFILNMKHEISL